MRFPRRIRVVVRATNVSPSTSRSPKPMIGRVDRITWLGEALPLGLKFLASLYGLCKARFLYFFFSWKSIMSWLIQILSSKYFYKLF